MYKMIVFIKKIQSQHNVQNCEYIAFQHTIYPTFIIQVNGSFNHQHIIVLMHQNHAGNKYHKSSSRNKSINTLNKPKLFQPRTSLCSSVLTNLHICFTLCSALPKD